MFFRGFFKNHEKILHLNVFSFIWSEDKGVNWE